jgi:hypothetical protein
MMEMVEALTLVSGRVEEEILLRNEYLAAENEILKLKLNKPLQLSNYERNSINPLSPLTLIPFRDPKLPQRFHHKNNITPMRHLGDENFNNRGVSRVRSEDYRSSVVGLTGSISCQNNSMKFSLMPQYNHTQAGY